MTVEKNTLVHIVIPTFNYGLYIGKSIQSVLDQTWKEIIITILDNHSTDNTEEVTKSFMKNHSNVDYIKNPQNLGMIGNYRKAMTIKKAHYVLFLSADDILHPTYVEKCMEIYEKYPETRIVKGIVRFTDSKGNISKTSKFFASLGKSRFLTKKDVVNNNLNYTPSCLFCRDPPFTFKEGFTYCFDFEFFSHHLNENYKIYFINEPLVFYREHPLRGTHLSKHKTRIYEVFKVLFLHYSMEPFFNQLISKMSLYFARALFATGNFTESLLCLTTAFIASPRALLKIYFWKVLILNILEKVKKIGRKLLKSIYPNLTKAIKKTPLGRIYNFISR
jgi:glycosyltransferase involved in cell wall biosynthesis